MTDSITINEFYTTSKSVIIIDVRSPIEYEQGHIPGAINISLFTNEQRHIVGTTYKQQGKQQAIKLGFDFFGKTMLQKIEILEKYLQQQQIKYSQPNQIKLHIHCWRGGMRSAAMAWLFGFYGFDCKILKGGYKAYRQYVLHYFEQPFNLQIIGGYTGSGKSKIIQHWVNTNKNAIDIEKIALHKGSAFGRLQHCNQPTQEQFENNLVHHFNALPATNLPISIEDESQRIGDRILPNQLWEQMRLAKLLFYEVDFDTRLENIIAEYGNIALDQLIANTLRIKKRLGNETTNKVISHLQNNEIKEAFTLLLKYYDRWYEMGVKKREPSSIEIINTFI